MSVGSQRGVSRDSLGCQERVIGSNEGVIGESSDGHPGIISSPSKGYRGVILETFEVIWEVARKSAGSSGSHQ